ncbi:MAG: alpha/beta-hydrolase family protein [Actinomycetes bacterium]
MSALAEPQEDHSLIAAGIATAGRITAFAALAGGAGALWDEVLHRRLGLARGLDTTLLPAVVTGGAVVGVSLLQRHRRATRYGVVAPERRAVAGVGPVALAKAAGIAGASALAFTAATAAEQAAARGVERGIAIALRRDPGALGALAAHGLILGALTAGGVAAVTRVTSRIQQRDDIVEPAFPDPPTSTHVSAGPSSAMPFDSIGKEGRRFVLMALSPDEITNVMGETAIQPVRIVGGYESADDITERARLTLQDMEDCGAFERGLIVVGSPTGVGYFNYSIAEALEYLTRGDCAIVVPQYALVPSALALPRTQDAIDLTRQVLDGIRERLAGIPAHDRPRVVLIGESLGANVALDLATVPDGQARMSRFADLGVKGGLYLGVPFRTHLWTQWRAHPAEVDGEHLLTLVSQPDETAAPPRGSMRHLMVVHHDDPVNKFDYRMVLQRPWWMGAPATRPPLVPREVKFRPITTFVLATVDLLNGMNSKPGTFVRRGHDYRIDIRTGLESAFGLTCSPEQADDIEAALRSREQEWATRRMVARKLDRARRAIEEQLRAWGQPIDVADIDPAMVETAGEAGTTPLSRLGRISGPPGS